MKIALTVFLLLVGILPATAQKHHLLADVGTAPGFSVTYNYNKVKWFGMGAGFQAYRFYYSRNGKWSLTPGLFADMRFNIRTEKRNQFFTSLDLGMNFYKRDKSYYRDTTAVYNNPHNNGFSLGLGLGYLRRITRRGGGPYISAKLITDWYKTNRFSFIADERDAGLISIGANLALSLGFKF